VIAVSDGEGCLSVLRWESNDATPETLCQMFYHAMLGLGFTGGAI
jgi:hypothetical protein